MKNDRMIMLLEGIANGLMIGIGIPTLINIISLWLHLPLLIQLGDQLSTMTYIMVAIGIVLAFKDSAMMAFSIVILALLFTGLEMTYASIIFIVTLILMRVVLIKVEQLLSSYQWLLPLISLVFGYLLLSVIVFPINDVLVSLVDFIAGFMSTSIISIVIVLLIILVLYYTPFYMISIVLIMSNDLMKSSHWLALLAMMTSTFFLASKSSGYVKAGFYSYFAPWHITKLFIANINVMFISLLSGVVAFFLNHYIFTVQFSSSQIIPIQSFFTVLINGLDESVFVVILLTIVLPLLISHTVYLALKKRNRQIVMVLKI